MARYFCAKNKATVTMKKVNEYCLLKARCPELMVKKVIMKKGRLSYVYLRVVPEMLADVKNLCLDSN